jgi:DNA-binding response OmpR family regulator
VDIQSLYRDYLGSRGIFVQVIGDGKQLLEFIESTKNFDYELIILDTYLSDMPGIDVVKKILDKKPEQRIVLTTTYDSNRISDLVKELGIHPEDILQKPFLFSNLISVINEKRNHNTLHFHD